MSELVGIAIITAIPATIAATAAWWTAVKTNRTISTGNGHSMGQLVESSHELVKSIAHRQDEMSRQLENHIQDTWIHKNQQRKG